MRRQFLGLTMAALTPLWRAAARQDSVLELEGVRPFIESMRAEGGFSVAELEALFAGLQVDERVITLMERPRDRSKKTYWREYRRRQLSGEKIIGGAQFMRRHSDLLARAEKTYGVPAAIVAAILGVETNYGKVLGRFHIVRALATLAFAYPRRAEEFQKQLREFLLYARQGNMDPLQLRGSFAGAFGWPQFLPGSARRFAVDFDGDGRADLFSPADAVGSVGNFLQKHGWLRDAPVAYPLSSVADPESLTAASKARGYKPFLSPAEAAAAGAHAEGEVADGLYFLVDLENRYDFEYRLGGQNFYTLTRYNKSFKYAAAVLDLSRALDKKR